jgi:uncharacterized membrane protein YkvA (DUF1232 family)
VSSSVPGPPKGRRRPLLGDTWKRIQAAQEAESSGNAAASLLRLLGDVVLLLKDLATDPRVSRSDKIVAGLAAAYLVSPIDIVPDWIPVFGQADDLAVIAMAFRRLLNGAGYDLIYATWRGSDEGLALVLTLAGVER